MKGAFFVAALALAAMIASSSMAGPKAEPEDGPRLLSAFFGLDNRLPPRASRLCPEAPGRDGMPVVLSHTIDPETLQADDFRVITKSGAEYAPLCATLRPARDADELRTVLLIGELGDASNDPPVKVVVVGSLLSDGKAGDVVDFRNTQTPVTPLDAGPFLVLAEVVPRARWSADPQAADLETEYRRGSVCPSETRQVVRVTWAGGVRLPGGAELGDAQRALYEVTVARPDGSEDEITPAAIADLGDRDNNHLLCLATDDPAILVGFPAGHFVDPNQDLNPATRVAVNRDSG